MYTGTVTDVSWERVFVTISGFVRKVSGHDGESMLMLGRFKGLYAERESKRTGKEPDFSDEHIERCFTEHAEQLKSTIGEAYDPDKVYFFLRNEDYLKSFLLVDEMTLSEETEQGEMPFSIRINVTQFRNRKEIPDGIFYLSVFHQNVDFEIGMSVDLAEKAFDISRPFVYDRRRSCYLVNFSSTTDEQDPVFKMQIMLLHTKIKRKFDLVRIYRETRDIIIKKGITLYYNILYRIFPHNGKRILFITESRGNLQGNLKAVYDRMIERGLDKQYKMLKSERRAAGGHSSTISWIRTVTLLAISDIILIDDYAPILSWMKLNKGTTLIQLWHAGVGFKSVGLCRFGANGTPLLYNAHRQYDYAVVGSTSLKKIYAEVFGIEEDALIPTGLPRLDKIIDKDENEKKIRDFYELYPDLRDRKLILFAPTFRGMGAQTAYYPYERLDMKRIYDMCGDEYVFIFKMHPFIKQKPDIPEEYSDRIMDLSDAGDVNDILPVMDILITDYSSVIYEFSVFRRPMLFFAYDRMNYSVVRGFQSDYDSFAPGKICGSFDELEEAIRNRDFETEKVDKFVEENFDYLDAGSSDRFIDWLILDKPHQVSGRA